MKRGVSLSHAFSLATVVGGPFATVGACGGSVSNPTASADAGQDSAACTECGGSTSSSGGYDGSSSNGSSAGGSSGSGSSGGGSSGGFVAEGTIGDSVTEHPLAGVSVCVLGSSSTCTMTNASGAFTLAGLAANASGFSASLANYVTENWPVTPVGTTTWTLFIRTTTDVAAHAAQAATTFDGATGAITFQVDGPDGGLGGATVTTSAGGKIVYFDTSGRLDPVFTATVAGAGGGFVFQLPAGTLDVTATASGFTCASQGEAGWPPLQADATTSAPIVVNQLTRLHLVCH